MTATTTHEVDYAHTAKAESNRIEKARTLARWTFERNVDAETIAAAPDATLRAWARAAGLSSASAETWQAAVTALAELEAWAAEHPDHEKAQRPHASPVTAHGEAPPAVIEDAPVVPMHPVNAEPVDAWPRGWDLVAALPPLTRKDARCSRCGTAAVIAVPVTGAKEEWRCAGHPPRPAEWGHRLDWTPRYVPEFHPDRAHYCYESRCPHYVPGATGTVLTREKATA